jgi:Caspase domain
VNVAWLARAARAWRVWRAAGLVAAAMACHLLAWAERHALLVGVSAYPTLSAKLQLTGPAHDVTGLRDALQLRGFAAARIRALADGVPGAQGLPTRAAILGALDELARQTRMGDTVVVLLSGHGSQEPTGAGEDDEEPDGLRETFLPRDIGRWSGLLGQVERAITDRELRQALDRISDTGAFLWAIFDACHSGTLVRGDEPATGGRARQVAAAELGVPGLPPPAQQAQMRLWRQPRGSGAQRTAYFYAAQSGESVKSLRLPRDQPGAPERGLLSYSIATALASGQAMTYERLAQYVLAQYGSHQASATPLFTGDGLSTAVLGEAAPTFRQWPLDRVPSGLALPAGGLDGIGVGALLRVLPGPLALAPPQPPDGSAGVLRVKQAEGARSELESIAWGGRTATAASALPAGTWVRLIGSPPSLDLRVAVDRSACADPCLAGAALDQLQRSGVPGVDVRWVHAAQAADMTLQALPQAVRYDIGARTARGTLGAAWPPGTSVALAARRVAADLHALARQRNLLELASQLALRDAAPALQVSLEVRPANVMQRAHVIGPAQVPTLRDGDGLMLRIHNPGPVAVDLTLLLLDGDHGVSVRYPLNPGESNRLEPKATRVITDMTVRTRTSGTERLVLVWVEMAKHRERRDFSFLEQAPLQRVRGRDAADPALQALLDACFADQLTRGELPTLPAETLGMQVLTLQVVP